MRMLLKLTKISLNVNFGLSALKYRFTKEKKKLWEPIAIGIAILFALGFFIAMFTLLFNAVYQQGASAGKPELVLTEAFMAAQLLTFFFGIFYIIGTFYFSKDITILVPLPLKPYHIIGSKFIVVMVNELITVTPILIPAIIIYGAGTGQGILYWLGSLLLLLATPAIPLIIAALFDMLLMRFVNVSRNKDLFVVVGGIVGLFFAFGVNFMMQGMPDNMSQADMNALIASKTGFIEQMGKSFPPSIWATLALSLKGIEAFGYFLLFMAVSVGLFILLLQLGNLVFYKSVLAGQESTGKKKKTTREERAALYSKGNSALKALFKKECKLLFKTPVFLLNGMAGAFAGPIIGLMPVIGKNSGTKDLLNILNNPANVMPLALGALGLVIFATGMNMVASTAISREGQTFWISKVIPVAPETQIKSKLLLSLLTSSIVVFVTGIIVSIVLKMAIYRILVVLILGVLGSVPMIIYNMMIDLSRPKLGWTNPQEAIKSNLNGILGMVVSILIVVILAAVVIGMIALNLPEAFIYLLTAVIISLLSIPGYKVLLSISRWKYTSIEM